MQPFSAYRGDIKLLEMFDHRPDLVGLLLLEIRFLQAGLAGWPGYPISGFAPILGIFFTVGGVGHPISGFETNLTPMIRINLLR